jgi:Uncharacterized conserved protein
MKKDIKKLKELSKVSAYLKQYGIHSCKTFFHEKTQTCMDARKEYEKHTEELNEVGIKSYAIIKSILYSNKEGTEFYLCLTLDNKQIDSKKVKQALNLKCKLPVASYEQVEDILKVKPGNVSIFSLLNDTNNNISGVYVDPEIYEYDTIAIIPSYNEITMFLDCSIIDKVIDSHKIHFYDRIFYPIFEEQQKQYKKDFA